MKFTVWLVITLRRARRHGKAKQNRAKPA